MFLVSLGLALRFYVFTMFHQGLFEGFFRVVSGRIGLFASLVLGLVSVRFRHGLF